MTPGAAGTASYHYRGETVAQDETDAAARLAAALQPLSFGGGVKITGRLDDLVQWLLPVVRELGDLRAAEELEAAADRIEAKSSHCYDEDDEAWEEDARDLRTKAAALRGEAGR